jgi:hypothetical protein
MATNPAQQIILKMKDFLGKTGETSYWLPTDVSADPLSQTAVATMLAAIKLFTGGTIYQMQSKTIEAVIESTTFVTSIFDSRDKLVLQFRDSMGRPRSWAIPNPRPACFVSPALQILAATGVGPTLASVLASNMVDNNGGSFTFVRGYRLGSRHLRGAQKKEA